MLTGWRDTDTRYSETDAEEWARLDGRDWLRLNGSNVGASWESCKIASEKDGRLPALAVAGAVKCSGERESRMKSSTGHTALRMVSHHIAHQPKSKLYGWLAGWLSSCEAVKDEA